MTAIDWTAFTASVTVQQVQQWKAAAKAANHRWAGDGTATVVVVWVMLLPMIALFALAGIVLLIGSLVGMVTGGVEGLLTGGAGVLFGILCLGVVALGASRSSGWRRANGAGSAGCGSIGSRGRTA
jgi:hypothetical protein